MNTLRTGRTSLSPTSSTAAGSASLMLLLSLAALSLPTPLAKESSRERKRLVYPEVRSRQSINGCRKDSQPSGATTRYRFPWGPGTGSGPCLSSAPTLTGVAASVPNTTSMESARARVLLLMVVHGVHG